MLAQGCARSWAPARHLSHVSEGCHPAARRRRPSFGRRRPRQTVATATARARARAGVARSRKSTTTHDQSHATGLAFEMLQSLEPRCCQLVYTLACPHARCMHALQLRCGFFTAASPSAVQTMVDQHANVLADATESCRVAGSFAGTQSMHGNSKTQKTGIPAQRPQLRAHLIGQLCLTRTPGTDSMSQRALR